MILDIAVWAVPTGIVGARIYHVITSPEPTSGRTVNLIKAFKIWEGGLGIWGGIAGGAVGACIACRRLNLPFAMAADTLAVGLPVAQALGRLGNWFNNELYGRETDVPWGLKVYNWDASAGHAQTVTASRSCWASSTHVPLRVRVARRSRRRLVCRQALFVRPGPGVRALRDALLVGRFWIEALRIDEAHHFLGLRLNNWTAIVVSPAPWPTSCGSAARRSVSPTTRTAASPPSPPTHPRSSTGTPPAPARTSGGRGPARPTRSSAAGDDEPESEDAGSSSGSSSGKG